MSASNLTINSNVTGVSIAEESEPRVLPNNPTWYERAVLSYSDFGGEIAYVTDDSINRSRQNQRGLSVGVEATGGYNLLMTNDLTRDMQGFFFADAHEKISTAPLNGASVTITSATEDGEFTAISGLDSFVPGTLVLSHGFTKAVNNAVAKVVTASSTTLTTERVTLVSGKAFPSPVGRIHEVGLAFAPGDLTLSIEGGLATLNSAVGGWSRVNLQVGEWIFVGGDAIACRYDSGYGYGRIASKTDNDVVFDEVAWIGDLVDDLGENKGIDIYIGTFIRNEKDPSLIKCRTYQVERTLGSPDNGVESQYLTGAVENELLFNIPVKERHTADFTYIALDDEQRDGTEGLKPGTRATLLKQKLYNTSSSVFRLSMSLLDPTTLNPTGMFAYASDATFTINNNATIAEAITEFGGFDIIVGNFTVGGSVTAYFTTVNSIKAIRNNSDVSFNAIFAQDNRGLIYDIPLLGVGGGRLNVEKDAAITIPIENFGAENDKGYTMSFMSFGYLPNIAMPNA